ncbi:MAG TPA: Omp28-related outer membrane protein [Saprospiraceae bacterium]|jgi:hypothetical protein|nr:Omp28-related outer membrane protein [Saprospiraceae bacterium]HRO08961.1 Omp28-related outer membrane protein [Saprospiraceae bacterium]HRP42175.1 Omp28-related outer membrane protein [Saprospiraceae bacterium]
MHKLYTLLFLCLAVSLGLQAQVTFSDNFDSYPADSYLGINNSKWTTWSGKPGTDEDAKVTSDKSKSPNNSVYIFAKDNAGGPMDLVLPFGQKFTKGTFIYRMNMFVPAKKTAYFNFQANEKIGDAWALNANFGTNGILALTNESTALMSTSFPIDEWFEIEFDINLSTNLWKLSINGDCKGSFANILNSIAYMDIFPTNKNCTFYIDDVYYEHTPTAKELVLDASIGGFTWNSTRLVGSTEEPTCFIQNNGSELINSATVVFSQTGQDDIEYELTDLALKTNQKSLIYLPEVTLSEGANLITVRITKVNGNDSDDEACNNISSFLIDAIVPAAHKRVLVEEGTGTWCVWCPRGAVFMDRYNDIYNDLFIPVAIHGGSATEPMRLAEYEQFIGFSSFPNCKVDRGADLDPSATEDPFLTNIVKNPVAKLESGAKYDEATRTLDVSVEVEYLEKGTGSYYVSLILTEDGVRGTTSGYNQANAYAGGGSGVMGGYELLPNPVPASRMVYNHVARAVSGLQKSTANTVTSTANPGDKAVVYFSVKLNETWNAKKMHIIPVLLRNGAVQNVNSSTIDEAVNYGYITGTKEVELNTNVTIYPNPTDDYAVVEFNLPQTSDVNIEIYGLDGSVAITKVFEKQNGFVSLKMPVQTLTSGIYLMKVNTNAGSKYGKIVISK